jgi:hypothetical protein
VIGRRLIALLVGVFILLPGPAFAEEDYPPPSPDLSVDHGTVNDGGTVTFTGIVGPGDTVTITVRYADGTTAVLGTTVADETGAFSFTATLAEVGTATITALGEPSGNTAVTTVEVTAASDSNDDDALPVTGQRLGVLIGLGAGALLVGMLLAGVTVTRRRRLRVG